MALAETGLDLTPGALTEVVGGRSAARGTGSAGSRPTNTGLTCARKPLGLFGERVGRKGVSLVPAGGAGQAEAREMAGA